jgi:hypothetical protein
MTDADRPLFGQALTMLAQTLNEPMSPGRVEGYFVALADLPIETVRLGIDRALKTSVEYFPKPGKLRELAVPPREYVLNVGAYGGLLRDASTPQRPVSRPSLPAPIDMAPLITAELRKLEGAVAERQQASTPDAVAARKAALREQADRLCKDGA